MNKILVASVVVVVVLIIAFFVQTAAIYSFGADGPWTQRVVQVLPYPVASVEGSWIRLSDFWENVRSQKQFYETQDFSSVDREIDFSSEQGELQYLELQRVVLSRMIEDEIVKHEAAQFGIEVTMGELQQAVNQQLLEVGNRDTILSNIRDFYGWTIDDYAERFVLPQMYRERLEVALLDSEKVQSAPLKEAEELHARLRRGADFAELARQESDDEATRDDGGDLGILRRSSDQLAGGQFDKVLFDELEEGEYSGVLRSSLGYHILKVDERISRDEVRASHIIIAFETLDEWLLRNGPDIRANILFDEYVWDQEENVVQFTNPDFRNLRDLFYQDGELPSIRDFRS